jgi:putative addiction module killer protein
LGTSTDDRGKSALKLIVNGRVVAYKQHMVTVTRTEEYASWFRKLRDARARSRIMTRIDRLLEGNAGDVSPIGDGLSELRIHHGPGYRVYFANRGATLILLLIGGDKDSQQRDIETAKRLAQEY